MSDPDLLLSSYDFELPEALIAQEPTPEREGSRLLQLDRRTGEITHRSFRDLSQLLMPGDVVVFNDTRVIPARLRGRREGGGQVEALLLSFEGAVTPRVKRFAARWEALMKPSARIKLESPIELPAGLLAFPEARRDDRWQLRLEADLPIDEVLEVAGEIPLPPYIRREEERRRSPHDRERYQTVYATHPGSAAAPTAGLHFSPGLIDALGARGIELHRLTLHVGTGTFSPLRTEEIVAHSMHSERYIVPAALWSAVQRARQEGRRIVAVGTTSMRALESAALAIESSPGLAEGPVIAGQTALFIYPAYRFRVVDAMLTNFHLPRSSLIILVSAFAGRERVLEAYRTAIAHRYRFFSYGDAMFIA